MKTDKIEDKIEVFSFADEIERRIAEENEEIDIKWDAIVQKRLDGIRKGIETRANNKDNKDKSKA